MATHLMEALIYSSCIQVQPLHVSLRIVCLTNFYLYDSKVMLHITDMEDGGQFGGRALIAWFLLRLHSFTRNTWIYIPMRCLHQFRTMFLGRGKIYD